MLPVQIIARRLLSNPFSLTVLPQLITLEAAAGFGKTCTTQWWLQNSDLEYRWLTLANSTKWQQHNARIFWQYLLAACQQLLPDFISPNAAAATDEAFIVGFLNALTTSCSNNPEQSFVLVIDNLHHLDDDLLLKWLDFFSSHLPINLTLVLLSRRNITLKHRTSRLAAGKLISINSQQLSFSDDESVEFLQHAMDDASICTITKTSSELIGWPLGLKLASLDAAQHSNQGLSKHQTRLIHNFLIEDVFSVLPQPLADLVTNTIGLAQLNPEVITELVTGINGNDCVELLKTNGLFLTSSVDNAFYSYQPLFRTAVLQHLQDNDAETYVQIRSKTATALESHGFIFAAIEQLVAIEQWTQASALIINASIDRIRSGDHQSIYEWLSLLPKHWLSQNPRLLYLNVLTATRTRHLSLDSQYSQLDIAEQILLNTIETDNNQTISRIQNIAFDNAKNTTELLEEIYNLRAELARNQGHSEQYENISWDTVRRASKSNLLLGSATDLGRGMELYLRGKTQAAESAFEDAIRHAQQENYQLVLVIAANYLAIVLHMMGRPLDGIRRLDSVLEWIKTQDLQPFPGTYLNKGCSAPIHCELNQLEQAEKELAPYLNFAANTDLEATQRYTTQIIGFHLLRSKGEYDQAEMALSNAQAIVLDELDNWNWYITPLAAYRAHLALLRGDIITAGQWAESREQQLINATEFRSEEERLILASVWIKQSRYKDALTLLNKLRNSADIGNRILHSIKSLILEALCHSAMNNKSSAQTAIHKALQMAEPCQFQRVFLDEGDDIAPLLQLAIEKNTAPNFCRTLLKSYTQHNKQTVFTGQGVLIEPLSSREVEILQRVSDGLRNKDIAENLSISISTVKAHIYNIFSKLQVKSRTEAVAQGRKLGIT
ncbi:LuxR C-terminal-related transcriptional regulator [Oceanicoccus sp. KOV_DT_Chl]|uniref:LuxR C-terminal-related transcriptional regulator n=1 Tax=Oceanicoccus sp. KOV_DT_Chl TaxID=1904639 RepID=UPI000C7DA144|nr:LuxR C-terminal-related transcriptional regulator [Oceanicoccus sp. KOV_DT_Chl]